MWQCIFLCMISEVTTLVVSIQSRENLRENKQQSCYNIPGVIDEYQHYDMDHLSEGSGSMVEKAAFKRGAMNCEHLKDSKTPDKFEAAAFENAILSTSDIYTEFSQESNQLNSCGTSKKAQESKSTQTTALSTVDCFTQTYSEDKTTAEVCSLKNAAEKSTVEASTKTNAAVQNKQLTEDEAKLVLRKSVYYVKRNMNPEDTVDKLMKEGELFFEESDIIEMMESAQKFTSRDANRKIMNILLKPRSRQLAFYEYVKNCFKETGQDKIVSHLETNEDRVKNRNSAAAKAETQAQNRFQNATEGDQKNARNCISMSKMQCQCQSETQCFFEHLNLSDVPADSQSGRTRRSVVNMPESTYM